MLPTTMKKYTGFSALTIWVYRAMQFLNTNVQKNSTKKIPELLVQNLEATYVNSSEQPDLTDYPDLSMYLSFVMSSDELHEIWACLELEEHLYED